jgi:hypothetical protein
MQKLGAAFPGGSQLAIIGSTWTRAGAGRFPLPGVTGSRSLILSLLRLDSSGLVDHQIHPHLAFASLFS